MTTGLSGIDHVIVGVRDLEQARATYERLGFRVTPRGRHVGWGTANYCLMFANDYVELLGIVDPDRFTNNLDRFLEEREGLLSIVLHTSDPEATRDAWRGAGLEPAEVAELGRLLEPETELRFQNVMLAAEATGGVPMFACAHLTPGPMRAPEWLRHPNGAIRIRSVTVVAEDPAACWEPMARVFGTTRLTDTDDTLAVHTGRGGVILIVTPDDLEVLHPELEAVGADQDPVIAALTLWVADPDATAAFLDRQGVPYRRDAAGAVGIAPEHTHGVLLEFTAAPPE